MVEERGGASCTGAALLFSAVIPAYNVQEFILDAMDSIAGQTNSEYEIVVVNDGSNDRTLSVVEAWGRQHRDVKLKIISQSNKGLGGARNSGIRHAAGEFIAFLDADDVWLTHKLEQVRALIEGVPSADVICHNEWLVSDGKRKRVLKHGPFKSYEDLLWKGNCLSGSATVVRRELLLRVGGFSEDRSIHGVEDYDLWLRLSKMGSHFEYIDEVLGMYRVDGQGMTYNAEEHCRCWLNVLERHFAEWQPKTPYYRYLMRRRRAQTFRSTGRAFLSRRDHKKAAQFLVSAWKQDPFSWKTAVLNALNLARVLI